MHSKYLNILLCSRFCIYVCMFSQAFSSTQHNSYFINNLWMSTVHLYVMYICMLCINCCAVRYSECMQCLRCRVLQSYFVNLISLEISEFWSITKQIRVSSIKYFNTLIILFINNISSMVIWIQWSHDRIFIPTNRHPPAVERGWLSVTNQLWGFYDRRKKRSFLRINKIQIIIIIIN